MLPFETVTSKSDLFLEVRIVRVIQETSDAKTFVLEPIGGDLSYKPGQFLTFVFPEKSGLTRRSYSLSSAPGEPMSVTIKRIPNGVFSRPLLELGEAGDRLTIAGGATGFFTLPADISRFERVLFLAAGSGITPVYSIIKSLIGSKTQIASVLVYSNSSTKTTLFREPLETLAVNNADRLKIEWLFSQNQDLWKARLNKLILEKLLKQHMKNPVKTLVYLCGPFDYMRMAAIVLQAEGIPQENIKREVFTPGIPKSPVRPPDVLAHQVEVHIHGKVHKFIVQFPDSILQAARKLGIELPYSCEAGRCGSCVATCTSGKIWMKYNEVLTDREVSNGRVLVCNGFPVGGDVVVKFDSPV